MKYDIIPAYPQNLAQDHNDPQRASTALQLLIPKTFSEKALRVVDYLADSIALYYYKEQFILTDEGLDLTDCGECGPRWVGERLEDLEAWLERICDEYDASPESIPGWISLADPKEWDGLNEG